MVCILSFIALLAQSLSPEAISHAQAGAAAQKQGHIDTAIEEFRKVTELQPELATGYANLGSAYFASGDYASAIPTLQHALAINPNLLDAHQTLGVALLVEGNAAAALPHLEKAPAPALLGLAYLETGKLTNAIVALRIALERQPDNLDALYDFGRAAMLASRQAQKRLAAIDPNRQLSAAATGVAPGTGQAKLPDPGPLLVKLKDHPDDPQLLEQVIRATADAADQASERILKSHPESARGHQLLAERYASKGKLPEAELEYAQSLSLNPFTPGVHMGFGETLAAAGDTARAITEFSAESKLRPASPDPHAALAAMFRRLGKTAEADSEIAIYQKLKNNGTKQ